MTAQEALIELMWRKRYNMAFPTKLFSKKLADQLRFPEEGVFDDIALMYKLLAKADKVAYHGLPKYTFHRHENNNSNWTTNHSLITAEILDEYLTAYRKRTIWLSERFPEEKATWQYFEWSFMISMVEKIHRLQVACEKKLAYMTDELSKNYYNFAKSPHVLDFEKKWLKMYINKN